MREPLRQPNLTMGSKHTPIVTSDVVEEECPGAADRLTQTTEANQSADVGGFF